MKRILRMEEAVMGLNSATSWFKRTGHALSVVWHDTQRDYHLKSFGRKRKDVPQDGASEWSLRDAVHLLDNISEAEARPVWWHLYRGVSSLRNLSAYEESSRTGDFSPYAHSLERTFRFTRFVSECKKDLFGFASRYEARVDRFAKGLRLDTIGKWKSDLGAFCTQALASAKNRKIDQAEHYRNKLVMSADLQMRILKRIIRDIAGEAADKITVVEGMHPLAVGDSKGITIATRIDRDDFAQTILDTVHELGHGLYRLYLPDHWNTHLISHISSTYSAVDEGMALMFEHFMCRTPEFAAYLEKVVREESLPGEAHPGLDGNLIYDRLSRVETHLNRTRSDPLRYPLHLMVYYDVERLLIDDAVHAQNIPALWQEAAIRYHGRSPGGPKENHMQDLHWAAGEIGHFIGGYLPGILIGAQCFQTARRENPDMMGRIAGGDFSGLVSWARQKIFCHGKYFDFDDLMVHATGKNLDTESYKTVMQERYPDLFTKKVSPAPPGSEPA